VGPEYLGFRRRLLIKPKSHCGRENLLEAEREVRLSLADVPSHN
jgi:hypothetical protein